MKTLDAILHEICDKGGNATGIIQKTHHPLVPPHFLVYSGNHILYIVSTCPQSLNVKRNLIKQDDIMQNIMRKVKETNIADNILYSNWVIDLPTGFFRIQKYIYIDESNRIPRLDIQGWDKIINISTNWINEFQEKTKIDSSFVISSEIKKIVRGNVHKLQKIHTDEPRIMRFLEVLMNNMSAVKASMPIAACHYDYCCFNFFFDQDGFFRVIDWEDAKLSDWIVIDYLSNLFVFWKVLTENGLIKANIWESLFNPQDKVQEVLAQKIGDLKTANNFSNYEIKFYLSYVCILIFLRAERADSRMFLLPYIEQLISGLQEL